MNNKKNTNFKQMSYGIKQIFMKHNERRTNTDQLIYKRN
jgi:hypothetical protein